MNIFTKNPYPKKKIRMGWGRLGGVGFVGGGGAVNELIFLLL